MDETLEQWLQGDYEAWDQCANERGTVRGGYWSPFVALAWIATRDESFLATSQRYEKTHHASRAGHSAPAWLVASNKAGMHFNCTFSMALDVLREALEDGRIPGVHARTPAPRREEVLIERHQWTELKLAHQHWGVELLPGLIDFELPSERLRSEFPAQDERNQPPAPIATASRPPKLTRGRSATPQQRRLATFFAAADEQDMGQVTHERLHVRYEQWNDRENKGNRLSRPVAAVKLSAFKKWRGRWRDGGRL